MRSTHFAAAVAALALTAPLGLVAGQARGDVDPAEIAVARSAALRMMPDPLRGPGDLPYDAGRDARGRAAEHAVAVPLPPGGNVNGIRWEEAAGTVTAAEIDTVVEYNAACQWVRAWADGREPRTAARVLADVPHWPALRGTEAAPVLARAVSAAASGRRTAELDAFVRDCEASHRRELTYAEGRGLEPPA